MRLDRILAHNLDLSRRQATLLCRQRRVWDVNGHVLADPAQKLAQEDFPMQLSIDEQVYTLYLNFHVLQNKPLGVITALSDRSQPTAYDLLAKAKVPLYRDLRAVGRLDCDTSGLLLWTTDGALLHRLTHPRYEIPRVYQAVLARPWQELPDDFTLADGYRPAIHELQPLTREQLHPSLRMPEHAGYFASITLSTGKFHEVRRIFAALGSEVISLCRVAFGPFTLPVDLQPGQHITVDVSGL